MRETTTLAMPASDAATSASTRSDTVVEVRELTKRFPVRRRWIDMVRHPRRSETFLAVDRVSFEVAQGEFFGLLGPNGAGKTTLFKALSTLIEPDGGTARIAGYDLRADPHRVRSVLSPVIADERSLNWRVSAAENLRFYATLYGLAGEARRRRVAELLDRVGLEEAGHKIVGAFSSGMKQRLLLARALLASPRVLLLDEPTRSLDPVAARRFRAFLREEIAGRQGCTILLATHNSEEALTLCDRVGVLDRGRMIALGSPGELTHKAAGLRYRVWTRMPDHPAFRHLQDHLRVEHAPNGPDAEGCTVVELCLSGDGDRPADVLHVLVREGVRVERFERAQISLAQLIEDLVEANGTGSHTS